MSSDLRKAILENISIEELLREEGFEVIPRGRKLTVKGHDSLVITPDKGVFTWNSRGFAGSVIDLYMGLHGCDARTAMTALRKRLPEYSRQHAAGPEPRQREPPKPEEKKPLVLPKKDNSKWSRVYAYLMAARKITPTVVKWLVRQKTIYPDERGNLCYVGRDAQGTVNYCARKGTLTPKDGQKGFRNVVEGSDYGELSSIFNGTTTIDVTGNPLICFSMGALLEGSEQRLQAVENNLNTYIWSIVLQRKFQVLLSFDELYLYLEQPLMGKYISYFARRSRKYSACIGVATQQLQDCLDESVRRYSSPIINMSSFKFLFYSGQVDLQGMQEALKLTDGEAACISVSNKRHCLLKAGNGKYYMEIGTLPFEAELFGNKGGV